MSQGPFGGVIPERVDGSPGKEIAMILAGDLDEALFEFELLPKDQPAPRRLEEDDDYQHHRHGSLCRDFRHILRQPVIKQLRLKDVQNNKKEMGCDHCPVEPVQAVAEPGLLMLG